MIFSFNLRFVFEILSDKVTAFVTQSEPETSGSDDISSL